MKKIKKLLQNKFNKLGYTIIGHFGDSLPILKLAIKIRQETDMHITLDEAIQLYKLVRATNKIKGAIAEVGTYTGASSKIICEAKSNKEAYFFDTFEGLPDVLKKDKNYKQGEYSCSYEQVKEYLKNYKNIYLIKGVFPNSVSNTFNKKFAFVHLDVDIYRSTLNCLEFFYPKMVNGGIILTHDYSEKEGVYKAFNIFFKDKEETIIELNCSQAMVIKIEK